MEEPIYTSPEEQTATPEKKNNTGMIIAIVIAVALVLCCCCLASLLAVMVAIGPNVNTIFEDISRQLGTSQALDLLFLLA